jgi:hypothetical protein
MPAATSAAQFHVISELVRQAYGRATTGLARIFHDYAPSVFRPLHRPAWQSQWCVRFRTQRTGHSNPNCCRTRARKQRRSHHGACGARNASAVRGPLMPTPSKPLTCRARSPRRPCFFRAARTASLMASGASAQAARLAWLPFRRGFHLREGSFSVAGRWEPLSYRELTSLVWFEQS